MLGQSLASRPLQGGGLVWIKLDRPRLRAMTVAGAMGEPTWGHAGVGAVDALADSRQRMEAVAGAIVLHPELLVSTGIIAAGQGEGRDAAVIEREAAAVARQRQQGHLPAGHRLDRE